MRASDSRYSEDQRYDNLPRRYAALTEDSRHMPVIDRRDYAGYPEPAYEDREQGRRRAAAPGRRTPDVGKRSGLELPDYDPRDGDTQGRDTRDRDTRNSRDHDARDYDRPEYDRPEYDRPEYDRPDYDRSNDDQFDHDLAGADSGDLGRGIDESSIFRTEALDRGALRRPSAPSIAGFTNSSGEQLAAAPAQTYPAHSRAQVSPGQQVSHGQPVSQSAPSVIYRPRRPGVAVLLALAGVVVEALLVRVLLSGEFASTVSGRGVLGGLFAMAGVPMVVFGLYGLATGAATAGGPQVGRAWLRSPLAYLPIGLLLIIAAGLAI